MVVNWRASGERAQGLAAALNARHGDGRALALQADVTDRAAVEAMVAEAEAAFGGPITTAVNNALDYSFNGDARSQAADIGWDEMERQFQVVVRGALNVIQACAPGMQQAGGGRIINIGTNLVQNPVAP